VFGSLAIVLTLGVAVLLGARALTRDDDAGVNVDRHEPRPVPAVTEPGGTPSGGGRPVLGAAIEWDLLREPGSYQRLFLEHYSSMTPENAMKMDALAPNPDGFDFRRADALVRWALDHGIAVHGHTLVWHRQVPGWVTERDWTRAELRAYLKRYVTTVVRRFRGQVRSWDVVNEPLTARGSLRRSLWERVLGPGYVADALRWAHAADPEARLYVNDFDLERPGPKSAAMYRLLRGLRRRQVPLDAVGLQAHLTPQWRPTGHELRAIMRRFAGLGLQWTSLRWTCRWAPATRPSPNRRASTGPSRPPAAGCPGAAASPHGASPTPLPGSAARSARCRSRRPASPSRRGRRSRTSSVPEVSRRTTGMDRTAR
jgi:hypothetical protein